MPPITLLTKNGIANSSKGRVFTPAPGAIELIELNGKNSAQRVRKSAWAKSRLRLFVLLGGLSGMLGSVSPAQAALELPSVFSDNMVIARDHPAAIWGWADPGAEVRVVFTPEHGKPVEATAKAGEKGRWQAELPALKGGLKGKLDITSSPGGSRQIANVAVGEVWFCSGQSNMFLQLYQTENAEAAIAAATDPDIRLLSTGGSSAVPLDRIQVRWMPCDPHAVKNFSAVAYYFAKNLRAELGVPVGLIRSAYNGTPIEAWMPTELLERLPETQAETAANRAKIEAMGKDEPSTEALQKGSKEELRKLREIQKNGPGGPHAPAALFNAMVNPFIPYPISGFLWYQGENNAKGSDDKASKKYAVTFPAMITAWRSLWKRGDLPFLYVELAGYKARQTAPVEENPWSLLRDGQRAALKLPNTGVATAIDIGSETEIHPKNKKTVGDRLAFAALEIAYGRKGEKQSPVLTTAEFKGSEVVLHFSHSTSGLKTKDGEAPRTFALRDANATWHDAEARIDGDKIILSCPGVLQPQEARYAWASNPMGMNVVNAEGLPLLSFRVQPSKSAQH